VAAMDGLGFAAEALQGNVFFGVPATIWRMVG